VAHNSLGSLVGRKFVIRSVEYHTVWYRLWPTIAWSAGRSQVCNTFRCIPCSLVPLVAHNSLRFIPYRLVACGSQIVIRPLRTIQSGTTWGPHFATVYTIRHGIAGGSPFALRWLRLFLGGVMVHHPWWSAQDTTGMDLNPSPSNSKASSRPRPPLGHPG
jgi:hypothetical protein